MTDTKVIKDAFENGMAVQRIADQAFTYERKPIFTAIGIGIGMGLVILGIFPIVKLLEGGILLNAIYGALMIAGGIALVIIASIAENRWTTARDNAYRENFEKVKNNLLEKSYGQGSPQ